MVEINILLTRDLKFKGKSCRNFMKCEVPIRSGPLDHRGLWAIDLEYFGYQELEESGLAHVQTPDMRSHDLIIVIDQRENKDC
jgi:hypothetical protein